MQSILRPALRLRAGRALTAARTIVSTTPRLSGGHTPVLTGEGAKAGEVPSEEQQATGLDRLQLLGRMQGIDVFNEQPLDASRTGTLDDPIVVPSLAATRIIGCSGSPAESHDTIWIPLRYSDKHRRCPECGSVYKLGYEPPSAEEAHAHH